METVQGKKIHFRGDDRSICRSRSHHFNYKYGASVGRVKPVKAHGEEQSPLELLEKASKPTPAQLMDDKALKETPEHLPTKHEFVLGKITHKLNNILQGMAGNADMGLLEIGDDSKLTKRFNNIISGIEEMVKMTKEMMQAFKPKELMPEVINVGALVENIVTKYTDVLKRHGIKLHKYYEYNINIITINDYLYDFIDNILLNAIQALGEVSKEDKIIIIYINNKSSSIKINVVDNGPRHGT